MSKILIENMEREVVRLQDPQNASEKALLVAAMFLADFVTPERMAKLYPNEDFHMTGPATEVRGQVVLAKSRKLEASWSWEMANDFVDQTEAVEVVYGEFEKCLAGIINEHALNREIVCPYVPLVSGGLIIDPNSLAPVMHFTTRYGVYVL